MKNTPMTSSTQREMAVGRPVLLLGHSTHGEVTDCDW